MDVRTDVLHTDAFLRTKISWMHKLPNFLTHGAPLRALFARESSAMKWNLDITKSRARDLKGPAKYVSCNEVYIEVLFYVSCYYWSQAKNIVRYTKLGLRYV